MYPNIDERHKKKARGSHLSSQRKVVEATSPMFDVAIKAPNYINCQPTFFFTYRRSCSGASLQRCIHPQSSRGCLHPTRVQSGRILLGNAAPCVQGLHLDQPCQVILNSGAHCLLGYQAGRPVWTEHGQ